MDLGDDCTKTQDLGHEGQGYKLLSCQNSKTKGDQMGERKKKNQESSDSPRNALKNSYD